MINWVVNKLMSKSDNNNLTVTRCKIMIEVDSYKIIGSKKSKIASPKLGKFTDAGASLVIGQSASYMIDQIFCLVDSIKSMGRLL
jgi:hypothetical protein